MNTRRIDSDNSRQLDRQLIKMRINSDALSEYPRQWNVKSIIITEYINCNMKHQEWSVHKYSIIVEVYSAKVLPSFHFYYKLRISLKIHISPLFRYEIRNKEDAKMTDFPRLFFWRKLSTVTWKQTICLSRLVTIVRRAAVRVFSSYLQDIIAVPCIRQTFQTQYIALHGISRDAIKLPMLSSRANKVSDATHA